VKADSKIGQVRRRYHLCLAKATRHALEGRQLSTIVKLIYASITAALSPTLQQHQQKTSTSRALSGEKKKKDARCRQAAPRKTDGTATGQVAKTPGMGEDRLVRRHGGGKNGQA